MDKQTFAGLPHPIALVVDDEPHILMDTADMVSEAGYHVIEARTADEALAFLKQHNTLKLIVTDVQMPGRLNGIELANYIGEHWPDISIIVASGAVVPEEGALPTHARFLNKPINQELVLTTIRELCD
ncbi:response regulator [Rhizobium sp. UBA1881]|uniref:response regulator n=1 Tax=Rhizobium sp. UBA1881 TaxID=1947375 RepID=UPI0025D3BC5F|nr:response regulator [Rhizobium sp. UBA1881]